MSALCGIYFSVYAKTSTDTVSDKWDFWAPFTYYAAKKVQQFTAWTFYVVKKFFIYTFCTVFCILSVMQIWIELIERKPFRFFLQKYGTAYREIKRCKGQSIIYAQLRGEQNSPAQNTKNQSHHFLHWKWVI